jgi:hypothetical protein
MRALGGILRSTAWVSCAVCKSASEPTPSSLFQRSQDATALGDRFLFAFVVSNSDNAYGKPFAVLLTLSQLNARVQSRRVQYQINLKRTTLDTDPVEEVLVINESGIQAVEPKVSIQFDGHPALALGERRLPRPPAAQD